MPSFSHVQGNSKQLNQKRKKNQSINKMFAPCCEENMLSFSMEDVFNEMTNYRAN